MDVHRDPCLDGLVAIAAMVAVQFAGIAVQFAGK
jgi:hypothetical protein